jgi:hypothetical protein
MNETLKLNLPYATNIELMKEIDSIVKENFKGSPEIQSEVALIDESMLEHFINDNYSDINQEQKNSLRKMKFNSFYKETFSIIREQSNGLYKVDLLASFKCENNKIKIYIFKYKTEISSQPSVLIPLLISMPLLLAPSVVLGPLAIIGLTLAIRQRNRDKKRMSEILTENNIKNYLIYKLSQFANENTNLRINID